MGNDKQSVVAGNAADDFLDFQFIDENTGGVPVSAQRFDYYEILGADNIHNAVFEQVQEFIVVRSFALIGRNRIPVLAFDSVDFISPSSFTSLETVACVTSNPDELSICASSS